MQRGPRSKTRAPGAICLVLNLRAAPPPCRHPLPSSSSRATRRRSTYCLHSVSEQTGNVPHLGPTIRQGSSTITGTHSKHFRLCPSNLRTATRQQPSSGRGYADTFNSYRKPVSKSTRQLLWRRALSSLTSSLQRRMASFQDPRWRPSRRVKKPLMHVLRWRRPNPSEMRPDMDLNREPMRQPFSCRSTECFPWCICSLHQTRCAPIESFLSF
mmetsp:Transcript_5180/g.15812  ORF Transcript_5180/g.15812 Transcript_5180/m.15812 type:complete len:213 (-) Transcript_5180:1604-2242(-)